MVYDPKKDLIQMPGKNGTTNDYLEVKFRLIWLRDLHPNWGVETELLQLDAAAILKASIKDETGRVIATGHGMAKTGGNAKWAGREIEKAETAAIGRALAHAGIGTQFIDDETEGEGDHLADSPVERKQGNAQPKTQSQSTAQTGVSVLDKGFSAETARNFLGWAKRNYDLSEESVSKILAAIAGHELAAMPMFPGTILDAIAGIMLLDAKNQNVDVSALLREMQERRNKFIAPHGKPFTLVEVDLIGQKMNKMTEQT